MQGCLQAELPRHGNAQELLDLLMWQKADMWLNPRSHAAHHTQLRSEFNTEQIRLLTSWWTNSWRGSTMTSIRNFTLHTTLSSKVGQVWVFTIHTQNFFDASKIPRAIRRSISLSTEPEPCAAIDLSQKLMSSCSGS